MANLKFRLLNESDFPAYDELIQKYGTIFAQRNWLRIFEGETNLLGLVNGSDDLVGAFPLRTEKRHGLRIALKSPFTSCCGPYFTNELNSSKGALESRRFFLTEICAYLKQLNLAICCISLDTRLEDCLPFRWCGYKVIPAYTYQVPLSQSQDEIIANFSSTRRRNIRSALRDSIEIRPVYSFEAIEKLAKNTFDRQGKKLQTRVMRKILFEFASPQNSFAYAAFRGDEPIAGVFCIFDVRTAYYLIGGYDASLAHQGAGAACMQEAILKAKSLGLETFDFEGSVIPPIERYFRGFGGELTSYFTANRAWLPIEVLLKFRKRELF